MTQHQKYRLIRKYEGCELREYLPCVIADVIVDADRDSAQNLGFRPLFEYISQNKIAMTAPVLQEEVADHQWRISFVMPASMEISELPIPTNSTVTLRNMDTHFAAAIKFSGRTTEKTLQPYENLLRQAIETIGLEVIGSVRIARFDPPWKLPMSRHNEMIIPVKVDTDSH